MSLTVQNTSKARERIAVLASRTGKAVYRDKSSKMWLVIGHPMIEQASTSHICFPDGCYLVRKHFDRLSTKEVSSWIPKKKGGKK